MTPPRRGRSSRSSFALLVAGALLAAGAAGCNKIKHAAIEDMIRQDLTKKGHTVKSVSCPEHLRFKESTFDCKGVDGSGKPLVFKIVFRPTEGTNADVRYSTIIDTNTVSN